MLRSLPEQTAHIVLLGYHTFNIHNKDKSYENRLNFPRIFPYPHMPKRTRHASSLL